MTDSSEWNEISDVGMGRPHVVILGAGASRAALPNGDKYGRHLPLMNDLIRTLNLETLLKPVMQETRSENFEDIYNSVYETGNKPMLQELERQVSDYFAQLKLPDEPTMYDHLVLSLRSKDLLATFNWDPFLCYAVSRCKRFIPGYREPAIVFLHGCVVVGYCSIDKRWGPRGRICPRCNEAYHDCPILYPTHRKSYEEDELIGNSWTTLQRYLKSAYILTVFGYSAPISDVSAVNLMKNAWGNGASRQFEQVEIIDIRGEEELHDLWAPFICLGHEDIRSSFYDSWIASHPRRSCEAVWAQTMGNVWLERSQFPIGADWDELDRYYCERLSKEED